MAFNAKKVKGGGGSRVEQPVLEPGGYPGRLVQLIDYGLQNQRPFKGEEKPPALEIGLTYELVDEFMVDEKGEVLEDKPRWVSEIIPFHNLKADKAKSTQRYKALDPSEKFDGDFSQLVGLPCIVNIVNNKGNDGKVYTNVASLGSVRAKDADKIAQLKNEPVIFSLDEPDKAVFDSLPEWIQEKLKSNLNYNGSPLQKLLEGKTKSKHAPAKEDDEVDSDVGEAPEGDVPW